MNSTEIINACEDIEKIIDKLEFGDNIEVLLKILLFLFIKYNFNIKEIEDIFREVKKTFSTELEFYNLLRVKSFEEMIMLSVLNKSEKS